MPNDKGTKNKTKRGIRLNTVLRCLLWAAGGIVLLMAAIIIVTLQWLTPERLTPMVSQIANKVLVADVTVGRAELSLRKSFPFLTLDADSLVIVSRDIATLPPLQRDSLPLWADTLLTVGHLHGGVNIFKVLGGTIELSDLEIHRPQANILVVNDTLNNFAIIPPSESTDTTALEVPDIRFKRFSLIDPGPIRYSDIAQDVRAELAIVSAELTDSISADIDLPIYRIDFDSNVSSPVLQLIGQESLPVGFDGIVEWRHDQPYLLTLKDFGFRVSVLSGVVNTQLDFNQDLTLPYLDADIGPVDVSEVLALVPDSIASQYYIPKDIETDAKIALKTTLYAPYTVGSTDLPQCLVTLKVSPCRFKWDEFELDRMAMEVEMQMQGKSLNEATVAIKEMSLSGPAASLEITGQLSQLLDDPLFEGDIDGEMELSRLPDMVVRNLPGELKGHVHANATVVARPSMFTQAYFHQLGLAGDIGVDGFFYLSDDTLRMYQVRRADLHFGTNERMRNRRGQMIDSLLSAKLTVDTANMLESGIEMSLSNLQLRVGAQNQFASTDTTLVIPMGGGISVGSFDAFSLTDTAGVWIRDMRGYVSMQRYKDDAHLPLFRLNLTLGKISSGGSHTRLMVSDAALGCSLAKLPADELSKSRREVNHIADSLRRVHPDLPVDSVYARALEIRRRKSKPHHHRVHPEMTAADNEVIDWGTSKAISRLLLDWRIDGSIKAKRAGLYTPSLPVRNRVENFNIRFNNDSLMLTDVKYKAGNSDFLISGNVTNLKRALTSKRNPSPMKINFSILSDVIDVNQLSHAFFTGSAMHDVTLSDKYTDEKSLEESLDRRIASSNDSVAPLLLPVNIDAELKVKANNVLYSDFVLHNLDGIILMYDGAINLHNLSASSDVGALELTALYSGAKPDDLYFGFGMQLSDFNISNFIKLVPAVDTIMPMLHDLSGIVNANLALTSRIDERMDFIFPSVKAAINLEGDSLSFIDSVTFKKVAKWLMFKDKDRNMIDHVSAQMIVEDGEMRVFPFIFDFDRYRLGIQGYNDFNMNFNYHIAVLKSPIPFKFGVNLSGNYDKLKIRLGGAKFNEKTWLNRQPMVNDTRVNLINQFQEVFRRGVRNSDFAKVQINEKPVAVNIDLETDTLTAADSLYLRQEGLLPQ